MLTVLYGQQVYQDYMDSAQAVRNAQRDRDTIQRFKIPHDKVAYCQYQWDPTIGNYKCVKHDAESSYIVYVGSVLPCLKKEES